MPLRFLWIAAAVCIFSQDMHAAECTAIKKFVPTKRIIHLDTTVKNCMYLESSEALDSVSVVLMPDNPAPYSLHVLHRQGEAISTIAVHDANSDGMLAAQIQPKGRKLALVPMLNTSEGGSREVRVLYTVDKGDGYLVIQIDNK